jgi:hypothetical protein
MIVPAYVAQVIGAPASIPTPLVIFSSSPAPLSERMTLMQGVDVAQQRAHAAGATLGVVVIDTVTGARAQLHENAHVEMGPMGGLPLAVLAYDALERGGPAQRVMVHTLVVRMLKDGDASATQALLRELGGLGSIATRMRALGLSGTQASTPASLAHLILALVRGTVLTPSSRRILLGLIPQAPSGGVVYDIGVRGGTPRPIIVVAALNGTMTTASQATAIFTPIEQAIKSAMTLFPA